MKSVITWEIERNIQFVHLQRKRYDTSCSGCIIIRITFSFRINAPPAQVPEQRQRWAERESEWVTLFRIVFRMCLCMCEWCIVFVSPLAAKQNEQEKHQFQFQRWNFVVCIQFVICSVYVWICARSPPSFPSLAVCNSKRALIHSAHCLANINIPCHMWEAMWYTTLRISRSTAFQCNRQVAVATVSYSITAKMEKVKQQIPFKKQQIHIFLLTLCSPLLCRTQSIECAAAPKDSRHSSEMNVQLCTLFFSCILLSLAFSHWLHVFNLISNSFTPYMNRIVGCFLHFHDFFSTPEDSFKFYSLLNVIDAETAVLAAQPITCKLRRNTRGSADLRYAWWWLWWLNCWLKM